MDKKIVILGAGLAGLSCAYHLKRDYEIYEKEVEPGGLCRSHKKDGFVFDYAGHLLHFKTPYVFKLVRQLLKDNLICHDRKSWIFNNNTYMPYPYQANFYLQPKDAAKECLDGLSSIKRNHFKPNNFYEWMQQKFGNGIVKHFMLPYNLKFWQTHPKNLSCEWIEDKVPWSSFKNYKSQNKKWGYNWQFWYPRNDGIAALPFALEKRIDKINYKHNVKKIDIKKKVVEFDNLSFAKFDYLVSTLPIPELEKIVFPLPDRVKKAIKKLKFLSILNLNLGISHNHFNKHWIYFPENKFSFFRLGFFSNFSVNSAPQGKTSIYTEVSYSRNIKSENREKLINKIISDLVTIKIIKDKGQINSNVINDLKYGYIIYDKEYSAAKRIVMEFLKQNNIYSIGRFGGWRYLSMEDSIIEGKLAAQSLN